MGDNRQENSYSEMAGNGVYARHSFVQWSAMIGTASLFTLCTALYGLPVAVLLGLLATSAYCGVTYVSFTLEGRQWRWALERHYEKLFAAVYGADSLQGRTIRGKDARETDDKSARRRAQISIPCHKEAQKMIQLIERDFIESWYQNVTDDPEFPEDCRKVLEHVALEINIRVQQIDLDEVVHELLAAVLPYLEAVSRAGKLKYNGVEIFDVRHETCLRRFEEDPTVAHRALRSHDNEMRYYRHLLDVVIQSALPDEYGHCDATCMFLREVLLHNILQPTLSLLCDPNFLNKAIPIILKKADPDDIQIVLDNIQEENKELERSLLRGKMIHAHRRPPNMRRFHSVSEHYYPQYTEPVAVQLSWVHPHSEFYVAPSGICRGTKEGVEGSEDEMEVIDLGEEVNVVEAEREGEGKGEREGEGDPNATPLSESEGPTLLPFSSGSPSSSIGTSSSGEARGDTPATTLPTRRKGTLFSSMSPFAVRSLSPRRQTISQINTSHRQLPPPSGGVTKTTVATVASSSSLESDSDIVYIDLAPIFATRYLHIRQGNSTYIGYVFKFPKSMLLAKDLQELGLPSNETHLESVKRYSDFTRLHVQLQRTPELVKHIEGLDLPEKHGFANVVSKLPFTSRDLDPTSLLERKQGLEKYIQLISSRPEILESRIFQEFLKSGVMLFQEVSSVHSRKTRNRRSLLGIRKGHSDEGEEAKPLPKRPMENVLSSYLNTNLPLPCRTLNTATGRGLTGQTGLSGNSNRQGERKKPALVKAATIGGYSSNQSNREFSEGKQRAASQSDSDIAVTRGAGDNLPIESEHGCGKTGAGEVNRCDGCYGDSLKLCHGTDTVAMTTTPPWLQNDILVKAKHHLFHFLATVWYCLCTAVAIVRQCSLPLTHHTLTTVTETQRAANPLSDVLLALGTEASQSHCRELWATDRSTQTAVLTLFGGAIDRYLTQQLHLVVKREESWTRMLYRLRHVLWIEGRGDLDHTPREILTESEREERKKMAIAAFKKFLPNFLPYVVGSEDYDQAVTHCLECLQNPQINRHFILRLIDILLPKLVHELHSNEFQKRLARLRTLTPAKTSHTRSSSAYSKKH